MQAGKDRNGVLATGLSSILAPSKRLLYVFAKTQIALRTLQKVEDDDAYRAPGGLSGV
jgi:hypothetical protein